MTEKKRIIIYDTVDRNADFKIALKKVGLTQAKVFRQVMTSFIENDELCQTIVRLLDDKSRKRNLKRSKLSQARDNKDLKKQEEIEKQFNLDNEELNDIFDLIAREHPDL